MFAAFEVYDKTVQGGGGALSEQEITCFGGHMLPKEEHSGKEKKIKEAAVSCLGTGFTCIG